jgi:hypothetical protein
MGAERGLVGARFGTLLSLVLQTNARSARALRAGEGGVEEHDREDRQSTLGSKHHGPSHGRQQNVDGSTGSTEPIVSPPLAWQVPGVRVSGPADLLPSAVPGGSETQKLSAVEVIVTLLICELQFPSLKVEITPVHFPPVGVEQAHAEHARLSSK